MIDSQYLALAFNINLGLKFLQSLPMTSIAKKKFDNIAVFFMLN